MPLAAGTFLRHYEIRDLLGAGGMGEVYGAHDTRLRRDVAIKLLPDVIAADPQRRGQLLSEARAASALNHPGITTIYEIGEHDDQLFIVMELVEGRTLRSILAKGPVEPRALVRIGAQMAEALSTAHARGIVHGDVKPENVMVQPDERVKLLDFGIARQVAVETATRAQTGASASWLGDSEIGGTVAYLAPEQLRGERADARADLFSFGIVLFEMAAGHRPFPGPTVLALVSQILEEDTPALKATLPIELARIVHKLLEKPADARYQSARDVQIDLTNLSRHLDLGTAVMSARGGRPALAVLPFRLLPPSAEDEYLGVALAEAVVNQIGAGGQWTVRPVSTALRFGRHGVDPLGAGRELNVEVVVEGSIQKVGRRLRVHVQAWNVGNGAVVLSAKHDGDTSDLFGLQDRLAESLARALGTSVQEARTAPPTRNALAYELFLRGLERFSRLTRWDVRSAVEMFEEATALDPRFADGWARLAQTCWRMGVSFEPDPRWMRRAQRALRRAMMLDARNPEAHCARGLVLWTPARQFQNAPALRAVRHALSLNPACYLALQHRSTVLSHIGLLDEASESIAAALAANPDDANALDTAAQAALFRGEYEEAEHYLVRALGADPASLYANIDLPLVVLYRGDLGRVDGKIEAAKQVVHEHPMLVSCEALLWARRGERRKAEQIVNRLLRDKRIYLHTHHILHHAAAVFSLAGRPLRAIALLEKASAIGLPNYPAFRDDPHFAPLADHPQFTRLLSGLERQWVKFKREFGSVP